MTGTTLPRPPDLTVTSDACTPTKIRRVAIALSIAIAVLYGLIAGHVVIVIADPARTGRA